MRQWTPAIQLTLLVDADEERTGWDTYTKAEVLEGWILIQSLVFVNVVHGLGVDGQANSDSDPSHH